MKKNTQTKLLFIVILSVFFCFPAKRLEAQVMTNFSPRFKATVNGDVTMIANNTISRNATGNYTGEDGNHDFDNNVYVDIDNDPTTFNSSSANFTNPMPTATCLSIRRALLYWAAADKETNGADNQPGWEFNQVKLMLPGETTYTTLTADDVIFRGRDTHFSNDPYICVKDITNMVVDLNSPFGTYQVANVEGKIGPLLSHTLGNTPNNTGPSGGWQIVYVYESPELTTKNVTLFDGYAHVTQAFNNFDIDFTGFQTIPVGTVNANVVLGSLEGDRDLIGDRLQISDVSNTFIDLSTPLRNADNFFNSRITLNNAEFLDRNPASTNTLGFDASVFPIDNTGNSIIDNNQTSATLRLTSNQETYGLFLIGLSVDVWSPNLYPIRLTSDAESNTVDAGQNTIFSFNFSNTGNDDAINVELHTTLPENLEFVSADNLPNGVTYNYNPTTRFLQFFIEDGLVDVGDPALDLQFEVQINDECYFLETSCDLGFELQLEATYNGVENPTLQTTLSSNGLDNCRLGNVLPITIVQPGAAQWATSAGALDRTFNCETISQLNDAQSLFPVPDKCNFNVIKTSGPFVPGNTCGSSGTYTNTWIFTDACGRTIDEYVQVITVIDDSPPQFDAIPSNTIVNCTDLSNFPAPNVTDSCSNNIDISFVDTTTTGSCEGDYSIERIWTAVDECGNTATASQTIQIQDTAPPDLNGTLEREITVTCEMPPEIPNLSFTDTCSSNIEVLFEEEIIAINDTDYDIIRTWDVYDDCANENRFTQTIHVLAEEVSNAVSFNLCGNDDPINLNDLVYETTNGFWQSDVINNLDETVLDPNNFDEGTYTFNYISQSDNNCIEVTQLEVEIGEICMESQTCIQSPFDVNISKLVTPNGDLKNQTFNVAYILNPLVDVRNSCNIIVKVKIFNRWGTKVYQSNDYQNDWAGTSGGGVGMADQLPTGTYYYVIKLQNSGLKPIQGYILLGTEQ